MTSPSETDTPPLRVESSRQGPVRHELEVEVSAERVGRLFDRAYRDLGRRARVRGFRPGRAPRRVLERLYGATVAEEVERELVQESLPEALREAGLEPVAEPAVDAEPPVPGGVFRYRAVVETRPEIDRVEWEGLAGQRPVFQVDDARVARELERLRERFAQLVEEPEGTPVVRGHVVTLDFEGRVDGKPFAGGRGEGVRLEVGSGRLPPGFEDQLVGARAGEEREIRIVLPETFGDPELAGREAQFAVRVLAVARRELPELDDEFAKDVGDFETLEELREKIREELRTSAERESRSALERSLTDALLERNPVEAPPALVDRVLRARLGRIRRELEGRMPEAELEARLEGMAASFWPEAEREVKVDLLLDALADALDLRVTDEEVEAHLRAQAAERGVEAEQLLQAYRRAGLLEAIRSELRSRRALERIVERAAVEEVPAPTAEAVAAEEEGD